MGVCVGVWVCVCAVIGIRKVSVAFSLMYVAVNVNIPTMFSLYVSTCECIDTVFLSISLPMLTYVLSRWCPCVQEPIYFFPTTPSSWGTLV